MSEPAPHRSWTIALLAIGAVAVALMIGGLLLVAGALTAFDEVAKRALIAYGFGLTVVTAATLALIHRFVRRRVVRAAGQLADEINLIAEVNPAHQVTEQHYPALLPLPGAINALAAQLASCRAETGQAVVAATQKVEEQKRRFEAILRDLSEGVVVCNLQHQVLLYNQMALTILHISGEIGLGRSLFNLITREPVLHAIEILTMRLRDAKAPDPSELAVPLVVASSDARLLLQGRVSLVLGAQGESAGYVLTIADATQEIAALSKRDGLLLHATEGMRRPLANLRAAVETLASFPEMAPADRQRFDQVIGRESTALGERLEQVAAGYRELVAGYWPMADIYSSDLLNCVTQRLGPSSGIAATVVGLPVWLRGDSFSLVLAIEMLAKLVHAHAHAATLDLECLVGDRRIYIDVAWSGEPIASAAIDGWLGQSIPGAPGSMTLRDVLDRHRSEIWSQPGRAGQSVLRLPVAAAVRPYASSVRSPLPPRPEFYDFDLLDQGGAASAISEARLRNLTYVVFDTETTGLRPDAGDEIIAIGGVRVVNGRILTGETFERLVNPARDIPASSVRFHGITDDMVADKPPLPIVLPQFKAFVGDSVLVAHNAAFDMKFLRMREAEAGVKFDNPVLDSLLLSSVLYPDIEDHSLDEVARRLGVEIVGRHSALGDALATAALFVRIIEQLEARGTTTLRQAMRASKQVFMERAGVHA